MADSKPDSEGWEEFTEYARRAYINLTDHARRYPWWSIWRAAYKAGAAAVLARCDGFVRNHPHISNGVRYRSFEVGYIREGPARYRGCYRITDGDWVVQSPTAMNKYAAYSDAFCWIDATLGALPPKG